jgi:hypothetical protein
MLLCQPDCSFMKWQTFLNDTSTSGHVSGRVHDSDHAYVFVRFASILSAQGTRRAEPVATD